LACELQIIIAYQRVTIKSIFLRYKSLKRLLKTDQYLHLLVIIKKEKMVVCRTVFLRIVAAGFRRLFAVAM